VRRGAVSQVASLIAQGADVNARDSRGWTLLHRAIDRGHALMVEELLAQGADPDTDADCGTPLHLAVARGHTAVVRKLIAGGADVNLRSGSKWFRPGSTPLHVALVRMPPASRKETVEMLLPAGADPNLETEYGNTALHLAISDGATKLAERFITLGVPVNVRNGRGETRLHFAAWGNHVEAATLLLDRGADVDSTDELGDTALHVACMNGYAELIELLKKRNADLRVQNDLGQTALDCTQPPGATPIVTLQADQGRPYGVIVTHPATVRAFLGEGIEFDRVWIPERSDIAALDLEGAFANTPGAVRKALHYFDSVRQCLPLCNREYAGFLRAGRKYLICNTTDADVIEPPQDGFTFVMDGDCHFARIVVDLTDNVVVRIDCDGP